MMEPLLVKPVREYSRLAIVLQAIVQQAIVQLIIVQQVVIKQPVGHIIRQVGIEQVIRQQRAIRQLVVIQPQVVRQLVRLQVIEQLVVRPKKKFKFSYFNYLTDTNLSLNWVVFDSFLISFNGNVL